MRPFVVAFPTVLLLAGTAAACDRPVSMANPAARFVAAPIKAVVRAATAPPRLLARLFPRPHRDATTSPPPQTVRVTTTTVRKTAASSWSSGPPAVRPPAKSQPPKPEGIPMSLPVPKS